MLQNERAGARNIAAAAPQPADVDGCQETGSERVLQTRILFTPIHKGTEFFFSFFFFITAILAFLFKCCIFLTTERWFPLDSKNTLHCHHATGAKLFKQRRILRGETGLQQQRRCAGTFLKPKNGPKKTEKRRQSGEDPHHFHPTGKITRKHANPS